MERAQLASGASVTTVKMSDSSVQVWILSIPADAHYKVTRENLLSDRSATLLMAQYTDQEWRCLKMDLSSGSQDGDQVMEPGLPTKHTLTAEWVPWRQYETAAEMWEAAVKLVARPSAGAVTLITPDGSIYRIERLN